jgi:hypothetical protein
MSKAKAAGTKDHPWKLSTPSGGTRGDWMLLGSADEQKPAAMYVPPVIRALGLAEVEQNPRNNRMRAI